MKDLLGRRVLVVAVVAGALLGVIGMVSAQEAGQQQPPATTAAPGRPGSQLDPNNPAQTGKRSCRRSQLPPHDGFENANRCVQTDQGEVPERSPSALITGVPENAVAGEPFQITASLRNVVRDRFAPAAKGGYYLFMSELAENGLVHGHAHIYVQNIGDASAAPDGDAGPLDFFKAVEDGQGGTDPDEVTVDVPGLNAGQYRACATLGDSSHRPPLMRAAKIAVGVDCVRFTIGEGNGGGGGEETTTTAAPETTAAPDTTEAPPDTTEAPTTTEAPPETTEAPPTTQAGQG